MTTFTMCAIVVMTQCGPTADKKHCDDVMDSMATIAAADFRAGKFGKHSAEDGAALDATTKALCAGKDEMDAKWCADDYGAMFRVFANAVLAKWANRPSARP